MDKKQISTALTISAVTGAFFLGATYSGLLTRRYSCVSSKVEKPVRLALVADLHGCRYGKNQSGLIRAIQKENPHALMLAGDIFDDEMPISGTMEFIEGIRGLYPCFYAAGNHEYRTGFQERLKDILRRRGVLPLAGERERFTAENGQSITVCGVDDPEAGMRAFKRQLKSALLQKDGGEGFTVLLTHRPELFEMYVRYPCDLVLAGHAHGGQWRIPYLINGLFTPCEGLFPKYAGGEYFKNGTRMIVSRGLARESTPLVPRVFNRPELVIIDILPQKEEQL